MTLPDDTRFLALLVHRGWIGRGEAELLLPLLKGGEPLDGLLATRLKWSAAEIARLRRTNAGEIPEIPGYDVIAKLGTGGTADVFRALDKKSGRIVALKVLKPECVRNDAIRQAFVREARLLEALEHPGLVKGFGVARHNTTYFARLECIDGSTLLEILDQGHPFGEEEALRIVLSVAETMSYLAGKELVHRDVKPGNVMLDSSGRVKLIDLGFAASTDAAAPGAGSDAGAPAPGTAVGTVAYLSPEQARGGAAADLRSDVYSLGVTLFHLVVGRLPFEGSKDSEVLRKQVTQALSSPELKSRGFSPHLAYFVQKMMAKEADIRYQSWKELVDDIQSQLAGREHLDFEKDAAERPRTPPPRRRRF
ncbi:MAG: serine/threonine protein kinase [Planctomycetes bacterium]|nr:serine/threonine protein kinase [Planctomycetota bacterium]